MGLLATRGQEGSEWFCVTVCALRVPGATFCRAWGGNVSEFGAPHLRVSSGDVSEPVGRCVVLRFLVGSCLPGTSGRAGVLGLESR